MDEAAVRVFWSPSPPSHAVTSVAVDAGRAWVYTGGSDGAIVRWHLDDVAPPRACVMLVGHTRSIRHLVGGLRDDDGAIHLLSVDDGGCCCLWREPAGRCVLQRRIRDLAGAVFGQGPGQSDVEPRASSWLLAAVPGSSGTQHPPPDPLHSPAPPPPQQTHLHQTNHGPGATAAAASAPVLLVIDWRSLQVTQALYMHPLQQLVCVDPQVAAQLRFSSGGGAAADGETSPTSSQRTAPPPWVEADGHAGGAAVGPASALLCLTWTCRTVVPQKQSTPGMFWDPLRSPETSHAGLGVMPSGTAGAGSVESACTAAADTVAVAVAVTPLGALYGCVVPYEPHKPAARLVGRGGGAVDVTRRSQCGKPAGVAAEDESDDDADGWQQQQPRHPVSLYLREPLLAAAVSSDLRWALLGAVDAWIVTEARWRVSMAPQPAPTTVAAAAGGGSDGGEAALQPRLLRISCVARCRISLMHQPAAMAVAPTAASGAVLKHARRQQGRGSSCPSRHVRHPHDHGGGYEGATAAATSESGSDSDEVSAQFHASPGRLYSDAGGTQRQQPHAVRAATHVMLLRCWDSEPPPPAAPLAAAVASSAEPGLDRVITGRAGMAPAPSQFPPPRLSSPRPPPPSSSATVGTPPLECPASSPHAAAGGSVGRTLRGPAHSGAVVGSGASAAEWLSGGSPDLARLSFAVYLPHSDGDGSVASSFSEQVPQPLQSPPPAPSQQQKQQQPQQHIQVHPQQLLDTSTSAAALQGEVEGMNGGDVAAGDGRGPQCQAAAPLGAPPGPQPPSPQDAPAGAPTAGRGLQGVIGGSCPPMAGLPLPLPPSQQQQQQQRDHAADSPHQPPTPQLIPPHHSGGYYRQDADHRQICGSPSHSAHAVLQALSWDGAGRQQVVSLTSDGRILAVQELSSPGPAPPAAAPSDGGAWGATGLPSTPEPLACRGFCGYLTSNASVARFGDGGGVCVGSRSGGGTAAAAGWVLGVHCYRRGTQGVTSSVLQWPLGLERAVAAPGAGARGSAGPEPLPANASRLTEADPVPRIGSLHDGWIGASALAAWRAQACHRRRASRRLVTGPGACGGGRGAALIRGTMEGLGGDSHGGVQCRALGSPALHGGYDVPGAGTDPRVGSDGGSDDDVAWDADADQARRRMNGTNYGAKRSRSGSGFTGAAATAGPSSGGDAAGDGDAGNGGWGADAAVATAVTSADQGRNDGRRRRMQFGGGDSCLPAYLYERWDVTCRRDDPWSARVRRGSGRRGPTWPDSDIEDRTALKTAAAARSREDDGRFGVVEESAAAAEQTVATEAAEAVVSASVLVCDGTATGEAVVLHCTADGAVHYCDAGAYAVPAVHRREAGAEGRGRVPQGQPLPYTDPEAREAEAFSSPTRNGGAGSDLTDGAVAGSIGRVLPGSQLAEADVAAAAEALRPLRSGCLSGHIGPVTCQLEVAISCLSGGPAAGPVTFHSFATALGSPSPPASPALPHRSVATAATAAAAGGSGGGSGGGGPVRVLLTGGSDGSLRAWHTAAEAFGAPFFALHPHGAPVRRVLLPRGAEAHAPAEFRQCVVSAAEDGSVALVCLERRAVLRVCRTFPYGMPDVVSWSFRRGFLACGGCDPLGQWTVAVYDLSPAAPSLDRIAVGSEATAILEAGTAASASTLAAEPGGHAATGGCQDMAAMAAATRGKLPPIQRQLSCTPNVHLLQRLGSHHHHHHHQHVHIHHLPLHIPHHHAQQQQQQPQEQHQRHHAHQQPHSHHLWQSRMHLQEVPGALQGSGGSSGGGSGGGGTLGHGHSSSRSYSRGEPLRPSGSGISSSASLPPPATSVASASSTPRLAPTWAYAGSFRTIYCHRPDVVLAAIDGEALLGALAAADAAGSPAGSVSSPVPVPRGPPTRGSVAARGSPARPHGPVVTPGITSPSTSAPSISPRPSRRPSLDINPTAAAASALATASSYNHSSPPVALPQSPFARRDAAAGLARGSKLGAGSGGGGGGSGGGAGPSRLSLEGEGSLLGGCSEGGAPSCRASLDESSLPDVAAAAAGGGGGGGASFVDQGGKRALASLVSVLHSWATVPRVDVALEESMVELGILFGGGYSCVDADPRARGAGGLTAFASGPDGIPHTTATAPSAPTAAAPCRANSAPPGRVCGSGGPCEWQACGQGAASRCGGGGGGGGADAAPVAAAPMADGLAALSAACSPQGRSCVAEGRRHPIPDPTYDLHDERYGAAADAGPCLVQPALVSSCGSVALAMPQAPGLPSADPWVMGDPTSVAARLLHIMALAGALGGQGIAPIGTVDCMTSRTAVRAATQVRHLCLVTARDALAADRAAAAAAAAGSPATSEPAVDAVAGDLGREAAERGEKVLAVSTGVVPALSVVVPAGRAMSTRQVLEPDLALFARRWMAADPRVREAAQVLLSAYTKPWQPVAAFTGGERQHQQMSSSSSSSSLATGASAPAADGDAHEAVTPAPPPREMLLPDQVTQLLQLRTPPAGSGLLQPASTGDNRRPPDSTPRQASPLAAAAAAPPQPPLQPQRLYPAAVIAAAACLSHPDGVSRQLFAAAAASLVELLCLPLTISGSRGGASGAAATAADTLSPSAHQPSPGPPPPLQQQQQQQQGGGLWADGRVLLPELAAAMLTAALRGPRAELWRQELQPWGRFVERLLHLVHSIPLPPPGGKGLPYDMSVPHDAAASPPQWSGGAAGVLPHGPAGHHHQTVPPTLLPAAVGGTLLASSSAVPTPQRAARRLADQAVALLAAVALLDLGSVLEALRRVSGGEPQSLHPLVAATLTRLTTSRSGRCRLAAAAPALGAVLAACAGSPAARSRPDLARPAYLAAADLASALPCAALHPPSLQLAVAAPLAAASPSAEPQFVTVYDLEHGNATWQLPLQPGADALQPLPHAAAALAGGGGDGVGARSPLPAAAVLAGILRGLAQAGVAALQFSPQGDHLAVLVVDGAPAPALLVYTLHLPWSHKLLMLPGAPRPALVVQPCHCWLMPGLPGLLQPQPQQQRVASQAAQAGAAAQPQHPEASGARAQAQGGATDAGVALGPDLGMVLGPAGLTAGAGRGAAGQEGSAAEGEQATGGAQGDGCVGAVAWQQGQPGRQQLQQKGQEKGPGQESSQDARLARVVDRVVGLRWCGQTCVEVLRSRTVVLARFMLPGMV